MAMTGGFSKLVHQGYNESGGKKYLINCYVYYKIDQSIANNKSTINTGFYLDLDTRDNFNIGPWGDHYGSYVGKTSNTFPGKIDNIKGGTLHWLAENKPVEVTHNSDGTGVATIDWRWGVNSPWGHCVDPKGSFTIDLPPIPKVPTLNTLNFSGLGNTYVNLSFSLNNANHGTISSKGIQIATDSGMGNIVKSSSEYSASFSGLTPHTLYYARGYATNEAGTTYTNIVSFTTYDKPVVNSLSYSSLTNVSAYLAFSLASDRGGAISSRGIQLSLSNFGGIVKTIDAYSGTASGLTPNTTYYARGYATNQYGTTYSNTISFKTHDKPSVSTITFSDRTDKSVYLSFKITGSNGSNVSKKGIQLSYSNFGNVSNSLADSQGTISGLIPNKKYYARGYATNQYGTTYTNTISFTMNFYNPGNPGKPALSYDTPELTPRSKITASWKAAAAGSTAIAGYRIRLFSEQLGELFLIDTDTNSTNYTFETLENYGVQPKDLIYVGIYSYCKDWGGTQYFNGDGAGEAQILSNKALVLSDKFIYISENNGAFEKHKAYISVNGASFKEIRKEKLLIIR